MADQLGTCDLNPEPHSWATHVQQEHHFRPSRWRPLPVKQPTALERQLACALYMIRSDNPERAKALADYEREYPKEKA